MLRLNVFPRFCAHPGKYMPKGTLRDPGEDKLINSHRTRKRSVLFAMMHLYRRHAIDSISVLGRENSQYVGISWVYGLDFTHRIFDSGTSKEENVTSLPTPPRIGQQAQDVLDKVDGDHCLVYFRAGRCDASAILSKSYACMTLQPLHCLNSRDAVRVPKVAALDPSMAHHCDQHPPLTFGFVYNWALGSPSFVETGHGVR